MTDPRETLARIRAQADAATDGPWEVDPFTWKPGHPTPSSEWLGIEATGPVKGEVARIRLNDDEDRANAEFITHARTDVPALVAALEAVLNLHVKAQPIPAAYGTQEGGDYCVTCAEDWPCPTVTAITQALTTT